MMRFGEVLKKLRKENKDTQQDICSLGDFWPGYVSAVEHCKRRPNEDILLAVIKKYPFNKKELVYAYLEEFIPEDIIRNIKENKKSLMNGCETLIENLNDETEIEVYKFLLEKLEMEHYKNGTYESARKAIEKAKQQIMEKEIKISEEKK